jgi:hypothetical protein
MRALAAVLSLLCVLGLASAVRAEETCVDCHALRSEARLRAPVSARTHDVHAEASVLCHDCHGGDPDEPTVRAHDLGRGFRGVPDALGVSQMCAGCHDGSRDDLADVVSAYRGGRHGRAASLGRPAASCTSCHGPHGIAAHDAPDAPVARAHVAQTCGACHASAAAMAGTDLPTDQLEQWRASVHGAAFATDPSTAPTCASCHDGHRNQAGLAATAACGQCHEAIHDAFARGPHAAHFEHLGFLDCAECHGSHEIRPADATLLTGIGASCARCHGPGRDAFVRVQRIEALADRLDAAREALPRGDPRRARLLAALHALDVDGLEATLDGIPVVPHAPTVEQAAPPPPSARDWTAPAIVVLAALALGAAWMARRRPPRS